MNDSDSPERNEITRHLEQFDEAKRRGELEEDFRLRLKAFLAGHLSEDEFTDYYVSERVRLEQIIRDKRKDVLVKEAFNKQIFEELLSEGVLLAQRFGIPVSLMMIDLDNFKMVNDKFGGHVGGDELLKLIGEALAATARRGTDVIGRVGGDEFAILLPGTNSDNAPIMAQALLENYQQFQADAKEGAKMGINTDRTHYISQLPPQSFSIGVATLLPGQTATQLREAADNAIYVAKERRKLEEHHGIIGIGKIGVAGIGTIPPTVRNPANIPS